MARIRTIKPEFFDDEHLCELSLGHRLCYIGLWTQADKAGRMEDRPRRLKARIFPFDDLDMEAMLTDLAREGFITRYAVNGRSLICIKESSWKKHQRPRHDEPESVLPAMTYASATDPSLLSDFPDASQRLGKEGNGEGERNGVVSSEPLRDSEPSTTVAVFSVVGKGGPEWALSERLVASWLELYPTIDVMAEIRKAVAWIAGNPGRRKTASGMPRFLVNWLNRATDRGGPHRQSEQAFTQQELQKARDWKRAIPYCPHEPKCPSSTECMARYIRERLRLQASA